MHAVTQIRPVFSIAKDENPASGHVVGFADHNFGPNASQTQESSAPSDWMFKAYALSRLSHCACQNQLHLNAAPDALWLLHARAMPSIASRSRHPDSAARIHSITTARDATDKDCGH
jgi:hypothetical protein